MLIAMVVIFAICWLPLNIVHMIAEFHRSELKHYKVLFLSTHVIAMSSTVYNPFLYSWLNDNFRKEFQAILPCLFQICSCFRGNETLSMMNNTPNGETETFIDRQSNPHVFVEPTSINGKTNGYSREKMIEPVHIQLTSISKENSC